MPTNKDEEKDKDPKYLAMLARKDEALHGVYVVEETLGEGSGGIAYKAYALSLRTDIVLKEIKKNAGQSLGNRAEVDNLVRLHQTNLPQVYDFFEEGGSAYTAMEYIPGENLQETMKKRVDRNGELIPFDQKQVLQWAEQLAEALSFIHALEPPIIHRDIKPANIMKRPGKDGAVCLIDFNISQVIGDKEPASSTGSRGYAAPEQYFKGDIGKHYTKTSLEKDFAGRGYSQEEIDKKVKMKLFTQHKLDLLEKEDPETFDLLKDIAEKKIDSRSDVYGLGATLYRLVSGKKPSPYCWENTPLSEMDIPVSEGFAFIIDKMMDMDPDRRYQDGSEVLEAIKNITALDTEYKSYHRWNRGWNTGIAVMAVAGIVLLGGGFFVHGRELNNAYVKTLSQAEAAIEDGDYQAAKTSISDAMATLPTRIEAYEQAVSMYYEAGDYDTCIQYGTEQVNAPKYLVKSDADKRSLGNIIYIIGNAYYANEDYANANACFETAIQQNAGNGSYFRDYALSLAKSGNIEKAKEQLETAKNLGVGKDSVYLMEGEIQSAEDSAAEAIESFQKVLKTSEDPALLRRAVLLLSNVYKDQQNYTDEIALLEKYQTDLKVNNMQLPQSLAEAYADTKQYDKAITLLQSFIDQGRANYNTYKNLAICYREDNLPEKTMEIGKAMLDTYGEKYESYIILCFAEGDLQHALPNDKRNYQKMEEYYEKALALAQDPDQDINLQELKTYIDEAKQQGWF